MRSVQKFAVWMLVLCGCPKSAAKALAENQLFIPPAKQVSWQEQVSINDMAVLTLQVRQEWEGPRTEGNLQVWSVTEYQDAGRGESVRQRFDVFHSADGYGYLGVREGENELSLYRPPQLVLPHKPKPEQHWSAVHLRGTTSIDRGCDLSVSEFCRGGVVSICDGVRGSTRTMVREHFCPGVGWIGYESLAIRDGQRERRWTENVVRDAAPNALEIR